MASFELLRDDEVTRGERATVFAPGLEPISAAQPAMLRADAAVHAMAGSVRSVMRCSAMMLNHVVAHRHCVTVRAWRNPLWCMAVGMAICVAAQRDWASSSRVLRSKHAAAQRLSHPTCPKSQGAGGVLEPRRTSPVLHTELGFFRGPANPLCPNGFRVPTMRE